METRTYTVYQFDELPIETREKTLMHYRNINVDFNDWYDFEYENWTGKLMDLGYKNIKISFCGFSSQGDGASFTADIDLIQWLKVHKRKAHYKKLIPLIESCEITAKAVRSTHHYVHEGTCHISIDSNNWDEASKIEDLRAELENEIETERRQLSKDIYKDLENDYDNLTTDESVIETLKMNEYYFTENGEID